MDSQIKKELEKVTSVHLNYDDNTTHLYIPKKTDIKVGVNDCYIIKLSQYMLNPPDNDVISSNWNLGIIPTHEYYKVDVNKIAADMINVTGIGYDIDNDKDFSDVWSGWIPRSEMEIIRRV